MSTDTQIKKSDLLKQHPFFEFDKCNKIASGN